MPNVLTGDRWTIDTQDAAVLKSGWLKIKMVYWFNPTTAGHLATIKDATGRVVLPLRCEADAQSQTMFLEEWMNGLLVDDLDSGVLHIQFD